ncbi:MAG: hypothetical protein K2H30_02465 [Clostridia bacterium]|nr:hypothetical protein [Clostridia bacterium]
MDWETLIAILTSAFALVTAVAGFMLSFINAKKDRVQKVILENRLKYQYEIHEGFSNFIGLANSRAIKIVKKNSDAAKTFYSQLFCGYGKIKTYIKPFFTMDRALVESLDKLYERILAELNGEKVADTLDILREDFKDKYLKYDWAYWLYIQEQKSGAFIDSDESFNKTYKRLIGKLDENGFYKGE